MSGHKSVDNAEAVRTKELMQYGGQAVIEGVMMRSPRYFAVACRTPDGAIVVQREAVDRSIIGKLKWLNRPFLRGTLALIDAMALGTRALRYASNVQLKAEQKGQGVGAVVTPGAPAEPWPAASGERAAVESPPGPGSVQLAEEEIVASAASLVNGPPTAASVTMPASGKMNDIAVGGTLIFSMIAGILLFKLVPTSLTPLLQKWGLIAPHGSGHYLNAVDGLIRMMIFFGYIALISLMPQIKRVFMYHGAEHKAINTLEAHLPLTSEQALRASRIHPRCGTSFIFVVLLIDLLVIASLPYRPPLLARFVLQVAVTPIVAGIAYEVIKFAGRYRGNPIVMAVFAPGMATQYLTTREPDADQTEVALAALRSVLEAEGHVVSADGRIGVRVAPNPEETEAVVA